jgi:hypothetical protein
MNPTDTTSSGGTLSSLSSLFSGLALDVGSAYQAINPGAGPAKVIAATGQATSQTLVPLAIIAVVGFIAYFAFKRG